MKIHFLASALMGAFLMINTAYAQQGPGPEKTKVLLANTEDSTQLLTYPLDIMAIISNKCLGCHQPGARSEKAREKLQWIQLQAMPAVDLIGKLDALVEVLDEGKMPPEKMLERFPDKKLTEDEVDLLREWSESTITSAMGE